MEGYRREASYPTEGPYTKTKKVIVDFQFTKNADKATTLDSASLVLLDGQGRESEADPDVFEYIPTSKDIFLENVNPGVTLVNTFEADCGRVSSGPLPSPESSASPEAAAVPASDSASATAQAQGCSDPSYKAQNPRECETNGYNPVSDPGDNYSQGVVVGDDTPDRARPEDVMESGLCAQ